jgi:hypothetical protein
MFAYDSDRRKYYGNFFYFLLSYYRYEVLLLFFIRKIKDRTSDHLFYKFKYIITYIHCWFIVVNL